MGGWSVSYEAVEQLRRMADGIQDLKAQIQQETENLKRVYGETENGLGAHASSLDDLIDHIKELENVGGISADMLALRVRKSARIREMHLEGNRYEGGNTGGKQAVRGEAGAKGEAGARGEADSKSEIIKQFIHQNVQKDRIPQNGTWENPDRPGHGHFTLNDDAVIRTSKGGVVETITGKELKERYGIDGVDYIHNEPDFTSFVDQQLGVVTVDEIPSRRDGVGGTYDIAIRCVAERLGWSKSQVKQYMEEHRLTWHESADRSRIMPVPTEINEAFKHTGGISKEESMEAVRDVFQEKFDGQILSVSSPVGFTQKGELPSRTDVLLERKRENHKKGQEELRQEREGRKGIVGIQFEKGTGKEQM